MHRPWHFDAKYLNSVGYMKEEEKRLITRYKQNTGTHNIIDLKKTSIFDPQIEEGQK